MSRITSALWVKAYLRCCNGVLVRGVVRRTGHGQAGAIFIKINHLDGRAVVYGPAPMCLMKSRHRHWAALTGGAPVADEAAETYIEKQIQFDSDIWVVEVEDKAGRHFLEDQVVAL